MAIALRQARIDYLPSLITLMRLRPLSSSCSRRQSSSAAAVVMLAYGIAVMTLVLEGFVESYV